MLLPSDSERRIPCLADILNFSIPFSVSTVHAPIKYKKGSRVDLLPVCPIRDQPAEPTGPIGADGIHILLTEIC